MLLSLNVEECRHKQTGTFTIARRLLSSKALMLLPQSIEPIGYIIVRSDNRCRNRSARASNHNDV